MTNVQTAVIIVAAGSGSRAGAGTPKQYRRIAGRTVLERTLTQFADFPTVVVIAPSDEHLYGAAVLDLDLPNLLSPVNGGATRQASVLAGLRALKELSPGKVLVHDAARPFVHRGLIADVVETVSPAKGAIPVVPVTSTIARVSDGFLAGHADRSGLAEAQTPQGFPFAPFLEAHEAAGRKDREYTDDASLMHAAGFAVSVVSGGSSNTKITTVEDLAMAEARFGVPDVRVGHGYDTHRLVEGRGMTLCGVTLETEMSLDGHSDADVGLHALTDALLATIGEGDIGDHFPPSDEQWRGVSSDRFLTFAKSRVDEHGGTMTHADVTLVCERPKIGPHRERMRECIATLLDLDVARVSVKATTNEERGFVGRGEGIVALATATVVFV